MPELPSGRRVGMSADAVLELARKGNFQLSMGFVMGIREPMDLAPLISIVYFTPGAGVPEPGAPSLSGLALSDVGTEKCDWSKEDVEAFLAWTHNEDNLAWQRKVFDEIQMLIHHVPPPLPDNLKGILD